MNIENGQVLPESQVPKTESPKWIAFEIGETIEIKGIFCVGSVLIWILVLICFIPIIANSQICACTHFRSGDSTVHNSIVSHVTLFECVPIMNLAVAIDCHATFTQTLNLVFAQSLFNSQRFNFCDRRPNNRPESPRRWWHCREFGEKREFPNLHVPPMDAIVSWGLSGILDRYLGDRARQRLHDSGNGLNPLTGAVWGISNISNNAFFENHIRPQLSFRTLAHSQQSQPSNEDSGNRDSYQRPISNQRFDESLTQRLTRLAVGTGLLWGGFWLGWSRLFSGWGWSLLSAILMALGLGLLLGNRQCQQQNSKGYFHSGVIVSQKDLTSFRFCNTVKDMANVLNTDKQIAVIGALAEGSSIRSIERITGVHRDTIMRLGVKVGQGCAAVMDSKMRDLPCDRLEMDEIWGFVGKKERNVREGDDTAVGSVWTFCAIDAETKLVPAFKVGERNVSTATAFVQDVASRMSKRIQISTDGLTAYVPAMESAFGGEVDYAQIVKTYGHEEANNNRRYSAPEFVSSEKKVIVGDPDERLISTSYVERLNATTRLHMRRLTRLTLAFSKKRENFEAAVALHFAYYNFVKRHSTIRCTPAMAAGVTGSFWSVGDLVEAVA